MPLVLLRPQENCQHLAQPVTQRGGTARVTLTLATADGRRLRAGDASGSLGTVPSHVRAAAERHHGPGQSPPLLSGVARSGTLLRLTWCSSSSQSSSFICL